MSNFSIDDVTHLARLARLALTDEEAALFARQLTDILAFARQVQAVDTSSVDASPIARAGTGNFREDEVQPSLPREELLAAAPAPDQTRYLFTVPRVFS